VSAAQQQARVREVCLMVFKELNYWKWLSYGMFHVVS
jgi:hypothetical protein